MHATHIVLRSRCVRASQVLFSDRTDGKGSLPHERAIMEAAVCTSVAHRNVVSTFHYDIKPVQVRTCAVWHNTGSTQLLVALALICLCFCALP